MTTLQATRFGLIRHAATLWNDQKRIQGQLDSPLSPAGQLQAKNWGGKLKDMPWQRIITSDLGRARETTALINTTLCLPVIVEPRLREQDWGSWSGCTLARLRQKNHDLLQRQIRAGWDFRPPAGESRQEVLHRCLQTLRRIGATCPGEHILIVCHEGVIKCLLYHLLNRRFLPEEAKVIQGFHLHLLELQGEKLYLAQMNLLALQGR